VSRKDPDPTESVFYSSLVLQNLGEVVDRSAVGKSSLLRPLEEEEDSEEEEAVSRSSTTTTTSKGMGGMFSVFRGLVGNKALSKVRQLPVVIGIRSGSEGSACFWAIRIRDPLVRVTDPNPAPDPSLFHKCVEQTERINNAFFRRTWSRLSPSCETI
jgi:hypothetical protein